MYDTEIKFLTTFPCESVILFKLPCIPPISATFVNLEKKKYIKNFNKILLNDDRWTNVLSLK